MLVNTFFCFLFFFLQFLCPISVQKALEIATPSFKGCLLSYWTAVQTADFRLSDVWAVLMWDCLRGGIREGMSFRGKLCKQCVQYTWCVLYFEKVTEEENFNPASKQIIYLCSTRNASNIRNDIILDMYDIFKGLWTTFDKLPIFCPNKYVLRIVSQ